MKTSVLLLCFLQTGCTFLIEHEEGKFPQIKVELPVEECELKFRMKSILHCEIEF